MDIIVPTFKKIPRKFSARVVLILSVFEFMLSIFGKTVYFWEDIFFCSSIIKRDLTLTIFF